MRTVYACPYCNHPFADPDIRDKLTFQQIRIFDAVEAAGQAGITRAELMHKVFFDRPDGGPENRGILSVQKSLMGPALTHYGLKIVSSYGHDARWRLMPLTAPPSPQPQRPLRSETRASRAPA
jgi:hypothetical protein